MEPIAEFLGKRVIRLWSNIDSKELRLFGQVWALALFLKTIVIYFLPLSADETYYWVWGKFPQLGYYDHPAFVSWLWSFGQIFDPQGIWAKWPAIIFFHSCLAVFVLEWKHLFPKFPLILSFLVLLAHPFSGLGGVLLTPDLPLMCFWFLSFVLFSRMTLLLCRSLDEKQTQVHFKIWIWASLLGLTLGLGFTSKYMMVLFGAFLFVWYILVYFFDRPLFQKIPVRSLGLIVGFGLVGCLPTLWWNFQNKWISFSFQIDHGFGSPSFDWSWPRDYVLGSLILSLPFLLFMISPRWLRHEARSARWILIFAYLCALGPFLFFLKSSLHGHVELNWPAMAYPFILLLALHRGVPKFITTSYLFLFWSLLVGVLFVIHTRPYFVPEKVFKEMVLLRERARESAQFSPLWTCDYQSASIFSFYSRKNVFKIPGCSRFDFYDTRSEFEVPGDLDKLYFYSQAEQKPPSKLKIKSERFLIVFGDGSSIKELELER